MKFGSSRIARKVSEYLAGSRKIWLKKYRFALRNNGIKPNLRPFSYYISGNKVSRRRRKWAWRLTSDYLSPLQTELRHAGLAWRVQYRQYEKKT